MTDLNITKLRILRFHSSGRYLGHSRSYAVIRQQKMWQANFERSKIEHLTFEMISNNFCFDQMRSCIYNLFTRIDLECPQLIEHSLLLLNINYHPSLYNFSWAALIIYHEKPQSWYPLYDFSWISKNSLILFSTEFSCQIKIWSWEWLK